MSIHHKTLTFEYKNKSVSVFLKYSPRKTIGISIHPDKKVEITAPFKTSLVAIQRIVERKSKWMIRKLEELDKYQIMERTKKYAGGQILKFLGRDYMVKVIPVQDFEEERIVKEKRVVNVYVRNTNREKRICLLIEAWYRNEAMIYLAEKFEQCYKRIKKYNIQKPLYRLRSMKRRWGSCTSKGVIFFNPEIIQLPSHCIEYIIMHELCHLKYRNHSKEFYHFLGTVMPEWEDCSQTLDSFLQI